MKLPEQFSNRMDVAIETQKRTKALFEAGEIPPDMMLCPRCDGSGVIYGAFKPVAIDCHACNAVGLVDVGFINRELFGEKLRELRLIARVNLREFMIAARECFPGKYDGTADISRYERGEVPDMNTDAIWSDYVAILQTINA